jgi:hypothetical protein
MYFSRHISYLFLYTITMVSLISSCQKKKETTAENKVNPTIKALKKEDVKPEIELTLLKLSDATKNKNTAQYLSNLPDDFVYLVNETKALTKSDFSNELKIQWNGLQKTNFIDLSIDRLEIKSGEVYITLSRRWERKVLNTNGQEDTIFSTYLSNERWARYGELWLPKNVEEREVSRLINGKQIK